MDGKKFVTRSSREKKLYPALRIWQNGNLLLFVLLLVAFQLTKIVILLWNHIYTCFVAAAGIVWLILNNSFISFYDVHVFQELPLPAPPVLAAASPARPVRPSPLLSTAYMCAIRQAGEGQRRNSTTISWLFGNQLAVTFLVLALIWEYIEKLFTFLLVYLTFHFLFAKYLFTRLRRTTSHKSYK